MPRHPNAGPTNKNYTKSYKKRVPSHSKKEPDTTAITETTTNTNAITSTAGERQWFGAATRTCGYERGQGQMVPDALELLV